LYSRLDDGSYLVTSDKPTGAEAPGYYDNEIVMGADFDRLLARHEARLEETGRVTIPFRGDDALANYEAIIAGRLESLVGSGEAYYIDPERTTIRSTLKGALLNYLRTLTPKKVTRPDADRPGPRPGATSTPVALQWAERICFFAIVGSIVLSARGPATTPAQRTFRLAVSGGALLGLIVVWVLKVAYRKRGPR
jgi:hypothetical protein